MPQYEVLEEELDRAIKRLYRDSEKHKRFHRRLRYAMFGISGMSTVLASAGAFSESYRELLLMSVVVTTAVAGLLTSVEGIRKPGELWLHERRTHYELVDLKRELLFIAQKATESQLWQLFYRMQTILSVSASSWAKLKPAEENDADTPADGHAPHRSSTKRSEWPSANRIAEANVVGRGMTDAGDDATLIRLKAPTSNGSRSG